MCVTPIRYGSNHTLGEFDLYYQDIQKRIKDQQWPNADFPHAKKIDITIVVDMLLTGFDSKYLNTLYVDKNLKYHGLIQAFSRTNRILNATKPYGNILDFRQQQDAVDAAIALFSGEKTDQEAREIWLVDKAPVVIKKLETAVDKLDSFMKSQGLDCAPEAVSNLKGDDAPPSSIIREIRRQIFPFNAHPTVRRTKPNHSAFPPQHSSFSPLPPHPRPSVKSVVKKPFLIPRATRANPIIQHSNFSIHHFPPSPSVNSVASC